MITAIAPRRESGRVLCWQAVERSAGLVVALELDDGAARGLDLHLDLVPA